MVPEEGATRRGNDYPQPSLSLPIGGRLSQFTGAWESVTSDQWVLRTLSEGYRLEFTDSPLTLAGRRETPLPADPIKRQALTNEIKALLLKRAIEKVPRHKVAFWSTFFLTPKKSGDWRPILNLKALNHFIDPQHFRMETLAAVLRELQPDWWGATLDLRDAYLHVPIHPSDRRWLGFSISGVAYRFRCLPFGLSTAPRTFTRVVKTIAEHLRRRGQYVFVYLDDWLITAPSAEALRSEVQQIHQLLQRLGFVINEEKSALQPSQSPQFLGSILDFRAGRALPAPERVGNTVQCAWILLECVTAPARLWMRLLGLIASLTAVLPQCKLRMRVIQLHVLSHYSPRRDSLSRQIPNSNKVRLAIRWWTRESNIQPGRAFRPPSPSSILTTDASKTGWGAHWEDIQLAGSWTPTIAKHHINLLELWTIHLALRSLRRRLKGQTVTVRCDNMSVVSYINKQGGTRSRSLCLQTIKLLKWCQSFQIELQAEHLPGADNVLADALSRQGTMIHAPSKVRGASVEWQLNPRVCKGMFNSLGRPLIDLFASATNKQLPTYCSWGADPMAFAPDAMNLSWDRISAYAFPPIALIPRVLDKLSKSSQCKILLIAPHWPRQLWFPRLTSMMSAEPFSLPMRRDLIWTPDKIGLPITKIKTLNLTVWQLSSDLTEQQAFRKRLQPWLQRQGALLPERLIIAASRSSQDGARIARSILIKPLWEK